MPTAEIGCGLTDGEQDGDGKVATCRKLRLLEIFGGRQKYTLLSPACWTLPTGWWDGIVSVGFVLMHCPPADTAPELPGSRTNGKKEQVSNALHTWNCQQMKQINMWIGMLQFTVFTTTSTFTLRWPMEARLFSELIITTTMKWSLIINKQQIYMQLFSVSWCHSNWQEVKVIYHSNKQLILKTESTLILHILK